jgi:integrase
MPQRITFTKAAIEAISAPPQGQRVTVYDAKIPKLALRVTAAGARTFYVIKRDGAGMVWVKLGAYGDLTIEQARKAADAALGEFAHGGNPARAKREARATMTLGEAFEQYMARHIEAKGRKSGNDLRQIWERCLGAIPDAPRKKHAPRERSKHPGGVNWQARKVNAITRNDVAALHVAIGKTTPTTANRAVELVSSIFGKLQDWGVAVDNPAHGVEPFRERKRDRFLQPAELPRFFAALAADLSEDFRDFVMLALLTGARRGNVLAMRWTDLDRDRALWRIPADEAKAGEAIDVALVPEAQAILARRHEDADAQPAEDRSPFVFPANSASGHMTPPKKRWAALFDRAELDTLAARIAEAGGAFEWANDGTESLERALQRARALANEVRVDRRGARIDDLRLHDLRRSLGSWQAILGASLPIVGRSLGHKSPSATAIYARLHIDPVRASVEAATSAMLVAGGVKKPAAIAVAKPRGRARSR